jgi:uncharacterized protein (DUF362 family)
MTKGLRRRDFIKNSIQVGMSAYVAGRVGSALQESYLFGSTQRQDPRIVVVQGDDYAASTYRAVELWGGFGKVISENSRVAILPNAQSKNPGAFTKPEIVRTTIRMIKKAGAKEVNCLSWLPIRYWEATGLRGAVEEEGAQLKIVDSKDEALFRAVPIPKGLALKETKLMKLLAEHDVFVNMPIMKDHVGNRFTGCMKNIMGLNFPGINQYFHTGDKTKPDDIEHLDQCIADLNTVCNPTLCIVDATEIISTNGPFGPGKIISPKRIVVGTDRIAIDSYCTTLLGMEGEDVFMIKRGFAHGLGQIDLTKVKIKEAKA